MSDTSNHTDMRPDRPGWWVLQSDDTSEIWCIDVRGKPGGLWHPIPACREDGSYAEIWGSVEDLTSNTGNRWLGMVTPEMFGRAGGGS